MRRAINWEYCAPKSRTTMDWETGDCGPVDWGTLDWFSTDECLRLTRQLQRVRASLLSNDDLSHYDIHQLLRHHDRLHDLLAGDGDLHFLVFGGSLLDCVFARGRRNRYQAAQLSIYLHGNFNFVFCRQRRVVLWPRSFQQIASLSGHLPQFVGHIRSHGSEQQSDIPLEVGDQPGGNFSSGPGRFGGVDLVDQFHDRGDAGIEVPASLEIFGDALDRLVQFALQRTRGWGQCFRFGRGRRPRLCGWIVQEETVNSPQETLNSLDARFLPIQIALWRRGKQRVHAHGIGAVLFHHLVRRDDVAQALRHLGAVFDYHPLGEEARDGFVVLHKSHVAHELRPEARINEMKNGVFDSADVLIDGKPVISLSRIKGSFVVFRVGITVEVPRRVDEGVHGVGLAAGGTSTFWAGRIQEWRHAG